MTNNVNIEQEIKNETIGRDVNHHMFVTTKRGVVNKDFVYIFYNDLIMA